MRSPRKLQSDPPILLKSEYCEKVYRSGRDMFVYTNLRVLLVDVKGMSGSKVAYLSLPLQWVSGFEVETAGNMDSDAEVYIMSDVHEKRRIQQDILMM